eukprot:3006032-Rhodomonas_salina.1
MAFQKAPQAEPQDCNTTVCPPGRDDRRPNASQTEDGDRVLIAQADVRSAVFFLTTFIASTLLVNYGTVTNDCANLPNEQSVHTLLVVIETWTVAGLLVVCASTDCARGPHGIPHNLAALGILLLFIFSFTVSCRHGSRDAYADTVELALGRDGQETVTTVSSPHENA